MQNNRDALISIVLTDVNMKFVVIEGLDGSGKSTQIDLLRNYLADQRIKYKYLHFPRTDSPVYGELVARFLRGELGDIDTVNPYLIALIYAGDRNDAREMLSHWIRDGYFVLTDRYVISNIAFQSAKIADLKERIILKDWILNLEYQYNRLPVPDLNIFLDVPFDFTISKLSQTRVGDDRSYLKGGRDIHEDNLEFQKRVREVYLSLAGHDSSYRVIDCSSSDGTILEPDKIFGKIIQTIF
jgi:dTMP kinase